MKASVILFLYCSYASYFSYVSFAFNSISSRSQTNDHIRGVLFMSRKRIFAGNWKLNTDLGTATALATRICELTKSSNDEVCLIPPYPFLRPIAEISKDFRQIRLGAQAVWYEEKGAFTGAISVSQLRSVGCEYVVIGHSERRYSDQSRTVSYVG